MPPRKPPVTNDYDVLQKMGDRTRTSAKIAERLGITVFQITARLKGMEKRGLAEHLPDGKWRASEKGLKMAAGPRPVEKSRSLGERVYRTPTGGLYTPGGSAAEPVDDSGAIHADHCRGWKIKYKWVGPGGMIRKDIFIDTEGNHWVHARPNQPAELVLMTERMAGLSPVRLVRRKKKVHAQA